MKPRRPRPSQRQGRSIPVDRYTERLAECGVVNSLGSSEDPYKQNENTLAETMNGLYRTELVRNKGPWWGLDNLELATLE